MTNEQIEQAAREYQDSLCLPEWDRKQIHGIDYKNGMNYALTHQWIPVEEELPPLEEGYELLSINVFIRSEWEMFHAYYDYMNKVWRTVSGADEIKADIKYWMEIPPLSDDYSTNY